MLLQASTRLLLVVAVLTTPTPGRGAAIGARGGRALWQAGAGADPSGREPKEDCTPAESSGGPGGAGSGAPLELAAAIAAEPPRGAAQGEAWQAGTAEPPVEVRPLLDIGELLAYERRRVAPEAASAPRPVTAAGQHSTPQLPDMVKSSLGESTLQGPPTVQRPRHPPRVDPASQKAPLDSTDNTTNVDEPHPQQEEVPKNVHRQQKPTEPQPPRTDQVPLPQTPKVPDTEEDSKNSPPTLEEEISSIFKKNETKVLITTSRPALPPVHPTTTHISRPSLSDTDEGLQHILPTLEDAIGSIFKNSEGKIPVTTGPLALPPVHPTVTDIRRPSLPDAEEDLKQILPTLEEALGSIFQNSEAKVLATTSRPTLPPVHPTVTEIRRPSLSDAEEDLKQILPTLEEALGSIFKNSEAKVLATTSRPAVPSVHPAVTDIRRPSLSDAEEDLKHILPTLEEALGSIFENSEAEVSTTSRPVPVLPPVRPTMTADSREQFAAVLPQLEEAIRSVLDEAMQEQEAAAQKHTTPASAWQPSPQMTEDYGFSKFLPDLERVFGDILHNGDSDHNATFRTTTVATSTVKMPVLPVLAPTEEKPSVQTNVIEPDARSSKSLFQVLKSTLQDVFNKQEVEAKTLQVKP